MIVANPAPAPARATDHLDVAVLDDVEVTVDGYVLIAGSMVGWLRRHPAGWSAAVAGAAADVPTVATAAEAVDRLLQHSQRGGPPLLEHLSPAAATHLIGQLGSVERHHADKPPVATPRVPDHGLVNRYPPAQR